MDGRVVAGLAPAQEAVQHRGVQQRLQRVVGVAHRRGERLGAVAVGGQRLVDRAEPVGLVVDDQVARAGVGAHPEHHVDRAGEVAAQRLLAERAGSAAAYGAHRVALGQVPLEQRRQVAEPDVGGVAARSPPASGSSKSISRSRSVSGDLAQRARRRAGRAASRRPRPARRPAPRGRARPATSRAARRCGRAARRAGRARRGSVCSSTACTSEPNVAPTGQRRPSATARRRADAARPTAGSTTRRRSSSSLPTDLRLAGDRAGRAGGDLDLAQRGVRRAPPARCRRSRVNVRTASAGVAGRGGSAPGSARIAPARATGRPGRATRANSATTASSSGTAGGSGTSARVGVAHQHPVQRRGDGVLGRRPPARRPATGRG